MRIYIEDSGEKEYGDNTSRYFVYAGVVVKRSEEAAVSDDIDALKQATFGTTKVEVKSNWLRIPKERKKHYLDPFGVTEQSLEAFVVQLLRVPEILTPPFPEILIGPGRL